jgi:hypothetical protein
MGGRGGRGRVVASLANKLARQRTGILALHHELVPWGCWLGLLAGSSMAHSALPGGKRSPSRVCERFQCQTRRSSPTRSNRPSLPQRPQRSRARSSRSSCGRSPARLRLPQRASIAGSSSPAPPSCRSRSEGEHMGLCAVSVGLSRLSAACTPGPFSTSRSPGSKASSRHRLGIGPSPRWCQSSLHAQSRWGCARLASGSGQNAWVLGPSRRPPHSAGPQASCSLGLGVSRTRCL